MKIRKRFTPLTGEDIVGIIPRPAAMVDAGPQRRLHAYSGRHLSAPALQGEQRHRSWLTALRGRALSPGVSHGLRVHLLGNDRIQLGAGSGLTYWGEDVRVLRSIDIALRSLPVYGPPAMVSPVPSSGDGDVESADVRRLGKSLGELIDEGREVPRLGVIVLQPVAAVFAGAADATDPCEIDESAGAFENWSMADGARLIYYPWPSEWQAMLSSAAPDTLQNHIAHQVFASQEAAFAQRPLPWEEVGVPVAAILFAEDWQALFLDRGSVVRRGGIPHLTRPLHDQAFRPFLWRARMDQFQDQISAFLQGSGRALDEVARVEALAAQLRFLPPVGLLPKATIDVEAQRFRFFPPNYDIHAVPIPTEQLDAALQPSACLAHYDRFDADQVEILVPVPQAVYEVRLLQREAVDPRFEEEIGRMLGNRSELLQRRENVRVKARVLSTAIDGEALTFADPDPEALDDETMGTGDLDPPEDPFHTEDDGGILIAVEIKGLKARLRSSTPITGKHTVGLDVGSEAQTDQFITTLGRLLTTESLRNKVSYLKDTGRLQFIGQMSADPGPAEKEQLLSITESLFDSDSTQEAYKAAIEALYKASQNDDLQQLDDLGLTDFIQFLEHKVRQTDDRVFTGFQQVNNVIFDLQQSVKGAEFATQYAISPAMSALAKGAREAPTQDEVASFYERLQNKIVQREQPPVADAPSRATGTARASVSAFSAAEIHSVSGAKAGGQTVLIAPQGIDPRVSVGGIDAGTRVDTSSSALTGINLGFDPGLTTAPTTAGVIGSLGLGVGNQAVLAQSPQFFAEPSIVGLSRPPAETIDKSIAVPKAVQGKDVSVAVRHGILESLSGLEISLEGIEVTGLPAAEKPESNKEKLRPGSFQLNDFKLGGLSGRVLTDLDPVDQTESAYFVSGVELADHSIATLRRIEGRAQSYRRAISICRQSLSTLQAQLVRTQQRLQTLGADLREVRHDVGVARVLLVEEEERIATINEHRRSILEQHVRYVAFRRPRVRDAREPLPEIGLEPEIVERPVPECERQPATRPAELIDMLELVREAPLSCFQHASKLVDRLRNTKEIKVAYQTSQLRASYIPSGFSQRSVQTTGIASAVSSILTIQQNRLQPAFTARKQLLLNPLNLSWKEESSKARESLSLGDLIEGKHGGTSIANQALLEFQNIQRVAFCLYAEIGQLPPFVRLTWTESLSQFDAPVDLRFLNRLPRWGEITDSQTRRRLQGQVTWLHDRMAPNKTEARDLMNDVVRVAILLASHAPTDQIIAGRVPIEITVKAGRTIDLRPLDISKVSAGMLVNIYNQQRTQVVAKAVVDNLTETHVTAKIQHVYSTVVTTTTSAQEVRLAKDAVVQFVHASSAHYI